MTDYERIEKVIRYLDVHRFEQPSLEILAKFVGLSSSHFHRLFVRWAGTTPKDFLKALTAEHVKRLLRESRDILNVSLEAGLSGPGRLHDLLVTVEGVSPGEFKSQGRGIEIQYGFHETILGLCFIGLTARGICHFSFISGNHKKAALNELVETWPNAAFKLAARITAKAVSEIFDQNQNQKKRPTLFLSGTPFQLKVWSALLRIPAGHLSTYSKVAASVGLPGASRAVGSAIGANPIAYLIPCHRVIRQTGVVGEYRWGTERKQALIALESLSSKTGKSKNVRNK